MILCILYSSKTRIFQQAIKSTLFYKIQKQGNKDNTNNLSTASNKTSQKVVLLYV